MDTDIIKSQIKLVKIKLEQNTLHIESNKRKKRDSTIIASLGLFSCILSICMNISHTGNLLACILFLVIGAFMVFAGSMLRSKSDRSERVIQEQYFVLVETLKELELMFWSEYHKSQSPGKS
jgi:hypothetical protein